jgi:perosamine synthetase
MAERLRLLRNHGQTALYQHDSLGYNWRLTEMQAAMGLVQLRKLDAILRRKRDNAKLLSSRLRQILGVIPPVVREDREHTFMLYTTLVDHRDAVEAQLLDLGIEARLYFPPAHRQPLFAGSSPVLPVTEDLSRRMLSLPFHSRLDVNELEVVANSLALALENANAF